MSDIKCIKCGEFYNEEITERIDHIVCEVKLKCPKCGHSNYWAYGNLEDNGELIKEQD